VSLTVQQMQPLGSSIISSTSAALLRAHSRVSAACQALCTQALCSVPVAGVAVAHERALQAQPRAELVDNDGDATPVLR
jgi:hypothetical protein